MRNARKNVGDFAVYFLTLMFGVAMVYAFGSITEQKAMRVIMEQADTTSQDMNTFMNGLSVFVVFVLGFLVLYANDFLMKRRGREFGTYLLLGLPKRKVTAVLAMETALVGALALVSGLVLGVFASQGMSLLSTRLFDLKLDEYAFVFSAAGALKTVVLFGVLFVCVAVLNTVTIGRRTVVTLLNSARRNQEPRVRRRSVSLLLLAGGLLLVVGAFVATLSTGLLRSNREGLLRWEIIALAVGTFVLFAGAAGILPSVFRANRRRYLRGLNPFVLRQIASKISTTHLTMSIVALAMSIALAVLSAGSGLGSLYNPDDYDRLPIDATFVWPEPGGAGPLSDRLAKAGLDVHRYVDRSAEYSLRVSDVPLRDILGSTAPETSSGSVSLSFIDESAANALLRLQGRPALRLGTHDVALIAPDSSEYAPGPYRDMRLRMAGQTVQLHGADPITERLDVGTTYFPTLVLPDALAHKVGGDEALRVLNVTYAGSPAASERAVTTWARVTHADRPAVELLTKRRQIAEVLLARGMVAFVAMYVGLVFLVSSAAILALQQLSEATDNRTRYVVLSKIGADRKMLGWAAITQVAVYFGIPLAVALVYSVTWSILIAGAVTDIGGAPSVSGFVLATIAVLGVYGGYFAVTSLVSRRIALGR
jgi:putative ABC transport system permease protein